MCDEAGIESSSRRLVGFWGPKDGAGGMDSFLMCRLYVASPRRNWTAWFVLDDVAVRAGLDRQLKPINERRISVGGIADVCGRVMGFDGVMS